MALSSTSLFSPLNTTNHSHHKLLLHSPLSSYSYSSSHFLITPLIYHNHNLATISQKWRTNVSFFPAIFKKGKDANTIKEELLDAIASLDRGADATPEDQQRVDQVAFICLVFCNIS
jgi:hypothetical protein